MFVFSPQCAEPYRAVSAQSSGKAPKLRLTILTFLSCFPPQVTCYTCQGDSWSEPDESPKKRKMKAMGAAGVSREQEALGSVTYHKK